MLQSRAIPSSAHQSFGGASQRGCGLPAGALAFCLRPLNIQKNIASLGVAEGSLPNARISNEALPSRCLADASSSLPHEKDDMLFRRLKHVEEFLRPEIGSVAKDADVNNANDNESEGRESPVLRGPSETARRPNIPAKARPECVEAENSQGSTTEGSVQEDDVQEQQHPFQPNSGSLQAAHRILAAPQQSSFANVMDESHAPRQEAMKTFLGGPAEGIRSDPSLPTYQGDRLAISSHRLAVSQSVGGGQKIIINSPAMPQQQHPGMLQSSGMKMLGPQSATSASQLGKKKHSEHTHDSGKQHPSGNTLSDALLQRLRTAGKINKTLLVNSFKAQEIRALHSYMVTRGICPAAQHTDPNRLKSALIDEIIRYNPATDPAAFVLALDRSVSTHPARIPQQQQQQQQHCGMPRQHMPTKDGYTAPNVNQVVCAREGGEIVGNASSTSYLGQSSSVPLIGHRGKNAVVCIGDTQGGMLMRAPMAREPKQQQQQALSKHVQQQRQIQPQLQQNDQEQYVQQRHHTQENKQSWMSSGAVLATRGESTEVQGAGMHVDTHSSASRHKISASVGGIVRSNLGGIERSICTPPFVRQESCAGLQHGRGADYMTSSQSVPSGGVHVGIGMPQQVNQGIRCSVNATEKEMIMKKLQQRILRDVVLPARKHGSGGSGNTGEGERKLKGYNEGEIGKSKKQKV